ncbi:MAG: glycoside hydrolase family 3 C-terminal domain-containing protein [Promethearchaeota archaeon]
MATKNGPKYLDVSLPFEERVDDLVGRMKLAEEISQLTYMAPAIRRLGVPPYEWWNECLHGVGRAGIATVFPQAIGLAATFDDNLLYRVAVAISSEARAKHHEFARRGDFGRYKGLTFWSPNVNIFRDPRWGRGQETYGEDPYLASRLGVAFVRGLQGDDPKYLKVVATPKHFAVHSGPEADRHYFDAVASPRDLWETYLPAFEACVKEGGAESVMCAYNRTNGELCCASPTLLGEVLRETWGFGGYVVSDCGAIRDFHRNHGVTRKPHESAALALKNGCDLNCGRVFKHLKKAVKVGLVDEATVDRSLKRLFLARFKLGTFDPPGLVAYQRIPPAVNDCAEHRALALEAARESIVLLKDSGGTLPLDPGVESVAVIGPNSDDPDVLLGNYNGTPSRSVTPLYGIRAAVSRTTEVKHCRGSGIRKALPGGLQEAVDLAGSSEVAVLCLGISNAVEGEQKWRGGGDDRKYVELPPVQGELLRAVVGTGTPTVLVLLNGGPVSTPWADEHVPAILEAWYPGEEGGTAVADVLFGRHSPSGRLPVTVVRSTSDLPPFADYSMRGRTYRYLEVEPLYPFGFGLSYTCFEYSGLQVDASNFNPGGGGSAVVVRAHVENTGGLPGGEVAQLYLRKPDAGTGGPRWSLLGVKKVRLAPGKSSGLAFELSRDHLSVVRGDGSRAVVPGEYVVHVGGTQPDERSVQLSGSRPLRTSFTLNTSS